MDWSALVCLVTGASSGIGREVAKALAARGATVIAVARRESKLRELVEELGPGNHSFLVCDVSDLEAVRSLAVQVTERTDHLDLLVNNAGMPGAGPLQGADPERIERVVRTNLLGPIWCTQLLGDLLAAGRSGPRTPAVVNVASMAGRIPLAGASTYTATKFGLVGFSEAVSGEMARRGVRVMLVSPGLVHTEGFPMDRILGRRLLRWSVMTPEKVAEAVCRGVETGRREVMVQAWWYPLYYLSVLLGPVRRRVTRLLMDLITRIATRR